MKVSLGKTILVWESFDAGFWDAKMSKNTAKEFFQMCWDDEFEVKKHGLLTGEEILKILSNK